MIASHPVTCQAQLCSQVPQSPSFKIALSHEHREKRESKYVPGSESTALNRPSPSRPCVTHPDHEDEHKDLNRDRLQNKFLTRLLKRCHRKNFQVSKI